jgi:hypothetical protein
MVYSKGLKDIEPLILNIIIGVPSKQKRSKVWIFS